MKDHGSLRVVENARGPNEKFPDGTTQVQRERMRVIYEDPVAYAEWRKNMGLAPSKEVG